MCTGFTSPRKNKWFVWHEARNKNETGEYSRLTRFVVYDTHVGLHAILLSAYEGKQHLIFYPPHFFSRYAERCDINLTGIELIKRYFKLNAGYAFHFVTNSDGGLFGITDEGVGLGYTTMQGDVLFKTFISHDMAKGDQEEIFRTCKEVHDIKRAE
ncbi:MAG: hypothetical protein ACRDDZ_05765 [Marinifilaceae bacterium]